MNDKRCQIKKIILVPFLKIDLEQRKAYERASIKLACDYLGISCDPCTLELMVENLGRANFGTLHVFMNQKKGIWEGDIIIDGEVVDDWEHIPVELTGNMIKSFSAWTPLSR